VVGGQLYISSASGAFRVATVGTGAPTSSGQSTTNLPGTPATGSPYQFFLARIGNPTGFAGPNVLYVADDTTSAAGGLLKYTFDGTTWTAAGGLSGATGQPFTAVRGLTGLVTGDNSVQLFAASGTGLVSVNDTTAGAAATFDTPLVGATAGTNQAFRGIAFSAATLNYNGGGFNLIGTSTFVNATNGNTPTPFFNAYAANFTGTAAGVVSVGAGVNPQAVNVSNPSGTYTFTNEAGSNGIQGLGSVNKSGGGTLELASPNIYTGPTTVTGGTLLVTNTAGSATGSGPVAVVAGTFGGTGTASGPLTTSAATVAPGSPTGTPGTLTTGQVIFGTGSTWAVRVPGSLTGGVAVNSGGSGTPGVANSQLVSAATVAPGINLQSLGTLVVDLTGATGLIAGQQYSLRIGSSSVSNSISGTQFTNITFSGASLPIDSASVQLNGNGVFLNFTPVPEPTTVLAVAAAGLGGLRLARRRLARRTTSVA
jgi:autotransporter-associated beta strand protein